MAACLWQLPGIVPIWSLLTPAWLISRQTLPTGRVINESTTGRRDQYRQCREYGRQLIEQPAKSVIILVSDFMKVGHHHC